MKSLKIFLPAVFLLLSFTAMSGDNENNSTSVNWLSFEEAVSKAEDNPKKIFMYIYTDWCGFCKKMEAQTFSNPTIAKILNNNFYPVKFNAEQAETVSFKGYEFVNENPDQRRSTHELAIALLQGKMSYPSTVFFNEELMVITALPGYYTPETFEPRIMFFLKDVFLDNPDLDEYIEQYESPY
ncbi:MAG: thioredoxin family protein [Bacteroidota bacterium]